MHDTIVPGRPCANCGHTMYIYKGYEAKPGEATGRTVITAKRFTHVYWLCANCGKNPRELWLKAQKPRLEGKVDA